MPLGKHPGALPPHVVLEAARLYFEIVPELHAVAASNAGVLFALAVSPQLADRMAACGASIEDDEDDGSAEADERLLPRIADTLSLPSA